MNVQNVQHEWSAYLGGTKFGQAISIKGLNNNSTMPKRGIDRFVEYDFGKKMHILLGKGKVVVRTRLAIVILQGTYAKISPTLSIAIN